MFYTLILENETGQQINLSGTANRYMFSKIKGLNPPTGTVSTSSYAGMNGSYLNNAFIEKRNVVILFEMRGFDVELRRHELKLSITLDTLTARILKLSSDSQSRIEPVPFYSWLDATDCRADSAVAPVAHEISPDHRF